MAQKSVTTRKTRRAAEGPKTGRRSARPGLGTRPVAVYEAASKHPLIPRVYDPSPSVTAAQQRALQVLARHLYRNDPFVRNLVNSACRLYVGEGPVPLSRFPELDALWVACSSQFDNTGRRSFGDWLRQDVYRSYRIDGEVFVRRRDRSDAPEYDDLEVPLEFECHTSEFCPHGTNEVRHGLRYLNGVATVRSKPVSYLFHADHPGEPLLEPGARRMLELDRSEIYHVHDPLTGGLRGEVLLASALLRAIKLSSLEDAELRRKQVAALMSVFIERPVDASDDEGMLPTEDEVGELIDSVSLTPGGVFQLPYGYKATSVTPADQPAAFEPALRWQLMAICASVGIPLYEVLGDDGVERWGRMMSQRVQAQARLERGMLEHQLLNRMRRDFIDSAMAEGLWTPPEDLQSWELYACEWQWPIIPAARLDQELNALIPAYEKGIITRSHITRTLFGLSPEAVDRVAARDAARAEALGHTHSLALWAPTTEIAARIANRAIEEESAELDLVESSELEDSILDDDLE